MCKWKTTIVLIVASFCFSFASISAEISMDDVLGSYKGFVDEALKIRTGKLIISKNSEGNIDIHCSSLLKKNNHTITNDALKYYLEHKKEEKRDDGRVETIVTIKTTNELNFGDGYLGNLSLVFGGHGTAFEHTLKFIDKKLVNFELTQTKHHSGATPNTVKFHLELSDLVAN